MVLIRCNKRKLVPKVNTSINLTVTSESRVWNFGKNGVVLSGNTGDGLLEHGEVGVAGGGVVGAVAGQRSIGSSGGIVSGVGVGREFLLTAAAETLLLAPAATVAASGSALAAVGMRAIGKGTDDGKSWGAKVAVLRRRKALSNLFNKVSVGSLKTVGNM